MSGSSINVVITVTNPDLSDEEIQEATRCLKDNLIELDGVEQITLIPVKDAPEGAKGIGGFLLGKLKSLVTLSALKKLVTTLGHNLFGSAIEVEAEGNGRKLKIKINKPDDLKQVMPEVEKFING